MHRPTSAIVDSNLSRALQAFCWCRGYRIAPARSRQDLQEYHKLVQQTFYEAGYFESPNTPLVEKSPHTRSQGFLARWKHGKVIGGLTVVQHPNQLPVQQFFHIQLPPNVSHDRVAELTRFVIERQYRTQRPAVSLGLLNAALKYSRQQTVRWWIWCGPSMFLWGFQAYFRNCQVLPQLPLEPHHIENRKGREPYFDPARSIQVVLVDLHSIDMTRAAGEFIKRVTRRTFAMWKRKRRPRMA